MRGREVVIADAVRTPIGRGHPEKGYYRDRHASTLLAHTYTALLERSGLPSDRVGDVVAGCGSQFGEQGRNIARNAWLEGGHSLTVAGMTLDRQCGAGQEGVAVSAALIASGIQDITIGSGVEHMGHLSFQAIQETAQRWGDPYSAALRARYPLVSQGQSSELMAQHWGLSRTELDEFALRSHRRAEHATGAGWFANEVVPVTIEEEVVTRDQGIRPDTSMDKLAALRPAFDENGSTTAGNASQVSDGAAAVLLASREMAGEHGLAARARIVDHVAVGVDPVLMLSGPIDATRRLLQRQGLSAQDIDRYEVNEAFATVPLAWMRELGVEADRVNVAGGAIALGHPLGCTGARLFATLLNELERSDGQFGIVTMCCAGGLGTATLIERLP
ncbi:thiolase family protein [Georgenia halophila]|uniref:Thiolase family protein n=1 Tax=Georgenia halophila TaxID=620889 RepID=A0ABP8LMA0_9MICO